MRTYRPKKANRDRLPALIRSDLDRVKIVKLTEALLTVSLPSHTVTGISLGIPLAAVL